WFNEFLVWDPADFDGMERIALPVEFLWRPDFYFYEFMGEDASPYVPYLYVNHNGVVTYIVPSKLVTSCHLDVFYFPFDTHTCTLTIGPFLSTGLCIAVFITVPLIKSEGVLKRFQLATLCFITSSNITKHKLLNSIVYSVVLKVKIRRRPTHYLVNLLIPSALLMLIEILSFFLPAHSTDRSIFKVTVLLGYAVFLLFVNDILPVNSGGTPLIGKLFLALMIVDLLESILISRIMHRSSFGMVRVPSWLRLLV
uniref:Neurotransmitter-gated ion-channel ligand-binding domain-containing protein n=1 Tax=Latimeria chalumnae TaxID=7897 RepID=H3B8F1_LATCH